METDLYDNGSNDDQVSRKDKQQQPNKRSNYIANVVFNTLFLVIVNKVPDWNIFFITEQFPAVLWALNLALGVQISANFMLIFHHPLSLHHISQTVVSIFQLISIYIIITIFPFDFSFLGNWFSILLKAVLGIAFFATLVTGDRKSTRLNSSHYS